MAEIEIVCRGVLFDMDGVLVDSTAAVARVWQKWASQHGFDPEYVAHIAHGRPSITTIRELLPNADYEAENRIVERCEIEDVEGVQACPGAAELLASLPTDRWALVTSSTRPLAEVRLRAGGHARPKHIVTSSDIVNGKPHPEPFLKAAAMLHIAPEDCIVIEDAPAGIQAGKAAGCRALALRTTMSDELLARAHPDWIADSCAAVSVIGFANGELRLRITNARAVS